MIQGILKHVSHWNWCNIINRFCNLIKYKKHNTTDEDGETFKHIVFVLFSIKTVHALLNGVYVDTIEHNTTKQAFVVATIPVVCLERISSPSIPI